MLDIDDVVRAGLDDPDTGWNMGSFGAIAEFHYAAGDPLAIAGRRLARVTARGGVRLSSLENVRPVAYETLSPKPHRWAQAVALCLPEDAAAMNRRDRLTELGPDADALRPEEFEGERNVLTSRIEGLEKLVQTQNQQIEQLSKQQEKAYDKVQDIANRAVEVRSCREIYSAPLLNLELPTIYFYDIPTPNLYPPVPYFF